MNEVNVHTFNSGIPVSENAWLCFTGIMAA